MLVIYYKTIMFRINARQNPARKIINSNLIGRKEPPGTYDSKSSKYEKAIMTVDCPDFIAKHGRGRFSVCFSQYLHLQVSVTYWRILSN